MTQALGTQSTPAAYHLPARNLGLELMRVTEAAVVDLLHGVATLSGGLPFTISMDEAAVAGKHSDVPGAQEPGGYAYTGGTGATTSSAFGRTNCEDGVQTGRRCS